jgi:hypothetical protein
MKNFSELLATDYSIDIVLVLVPVLENGAPHAKVIINNQVLWNQELKHQVIVTHTVKLLDPIHISVEMTNKKYSAEHETAVIIESIKIDNFEMIPNFIHLAQYVNDAEIKTITSYLGYNGCWTLTQHLPFYQWQHQVTGQGWLLQPAN